MPLFTLSPCPSYVSTGGKVELEKLSDAEIEEVKDVVSELLALLEGDEVAEGVSMVPDSLLNASDDVSEGSTNVVLDLIGHVYEGVSDSLAKSLDDDKVVQYEKLSVVGVGSG
ncbi:unnamed protein product [Alternaria sp. RS040]